MLELLRPDVKKTRKALQELGTRLDKRHKGAWVRDALTKQIARDSIKDDAVVFIDSVRMSGQIDAIRESYGRSVIHIHITAPVEELTKRYKDRIEQKKGKLEELRSYRQVMSDPTESRVEELQDVADVVINSKLCTEDDVVVRAAAHIGMYGREYLRLVDVLVGGQYGSEGKGQIAEYLAR